MDRKGSLHLQSEAPHSLQSHGKSVVNRRDYRPDKNISMAGQLTFLSKRKVLYVKSPHEVSKSLYRIPLLFTESHTEEKPISSAELVLSPYKEKVMAAPSF